jgi:DNA helicase HerA-like ATPase
MQPPPFSERRGVPAETQVRIAHLVSVSGSNAVAVVERSSDMPGRERDTRIQIGSLVQIRTPDAAVIGIISAMSAPMPDMHDANREDLGLIEINLAGEIIVAGKSARLTFRRGVGNLPSLGDPVFLAGKHDLTRIFAPPNVASIQVGKLFQDERVPARLLTDELLSKHFIIAGSTGSGKSCALTSILQRLLEGHEAAHVVILDIHNEYSYAFGDHVERIEIDSFSLPLWMLNFHELCAALVSTDGGQDDEIEILNEAVLYAKRRYFEAATGRASLMRRHADSLIITVDTPAPFRVSDLTAYIDDQLGKLDRTRNTLPYKRLKAKIEVLVADQRYNFMFGGLTVQDTMSEVLGRIFRVPNEGKPISVLDLSTVPHEILDVVISVIARLAFDLAVWSQGGLPMLLVCEEAHRYAPANGDDKFMPTRKALGRIAKEGRKYAISLALVTQRPSELDPTILSQCSTAIALRLSSERDQQVIRGSTHEGLIDLTDFLPLLGDREAIILGQGTAMPMRIRFDELPEANAPRNMNPGFSKSWKTKNMDRERLDQIVSRWRMTGRDTKG